MREKRYLITYFIALAALHIFALIAVWGAWVYLKRIGEISLDRVVERQASGEFCLFGSGIEQDNFTYKLALYQRYKPDLVILGSSRVMQMRGRYFQGPFLNMGGAVGSIASLESVFDNMLVQHVPKVILIGLDFWWFNPNHESTKNNFKAPIGSYDLTLDRLKLPYFWLAESKITFQDFFQVIMNTQETANNKHRMGVMSWKLDDGFGPDGSYYYTSYITGIRPPEDPKFADTLERIARRTARFEGSRTLSHDLIIRLKQLVERLERKGARVVLFLPPLASVP